MIKKNLKVLIITSLVILLPILAGVILWSQLPDMLPVHWNVAGAVDGWSSKPFAVFGMPAIMLGFHWICVLGTSADPKKQNHSEKILHLVFWMIPVINLVVSGLMYFAAAGIELPIVAIMLSFVGVVFIIIGNYLPKCQQNYTIGIKIPWTLNSEENWNRTHRFAGWLWVICGLMMVLAGFIFAESVIAVWVFLPVTLVMIAAPFAYSYILHRKGI